MVKGKIRNEVGRDEKPEDRKSLSANDQISPSVSFILRYHLLSNKLA